MQLCGLVRFGHRGAIISVAGHTHRCRYSKRSAGLGRTPKFGQGPCPILQRNREKTTYRSSAHRLTATIRHRAIGIFTWHYTPCLRTQQRCCHHAPALTDSSSTLARQTELRILTLKPPTWTALHHYETNAGPNSPDQRHPDTTRHRSNPKGLTADISPLTACKLLV